VKGDQLFESQCPLNDSERTWMQAVLYASIMGSLMFAQVCIRPNIAYAIGVLGRYLSDPSLNNSKATKPH
jgi:hypothetical protein